MPVMPACPPAAQIAKTLNERISKYCQVTLDSLAYAGTGNVLKVQELLAMCGEHIETDEGTTWKVIWGTGGSRSETDVAPEHSEVTLRLLPVICCVPSSGTSDAASNKGVVLFGIIGMFVTPVAMYCTLAQSPSIIQLANPRCL